MHTTDLAAMAARLGAVEEAATRFSGGEFVPVPDPPAARAAGGATGTAIPWTLLVQGGAAQVRVWNGCLQFRGDMATIDKASPQIVKLPEGFPTPTRVHRQPVRARGTNNGSRHACATVSPEGWVGVETEAVLKDWVLDGVLVPLD
jgi:hypothetical protein